MHSICRLKRKEVERGKEEQILYNIYIPRYICIVCLNTLPLTCPTLNSTVLQTPVNTSSQKMMEEKMLKKTHVRAARLHKLQYSSMNTVRYLGTEEPAHQLRYTYTVLIHTPPHHPPRHNPGMN